MKKLAILLFISLGLWPQPQERDCYGPFRHGSPTPSPKRTENHIGGPEYDGHKITVNLPDADILRNTGGMGRRGPGTGAGLCTFTAIDECARWQYVTPVIGFQKFMTDKPGGGSPKKIDAMLKLLTKEPLSYISDTSGNEKLFEQIMASGRAVAMNYGYSPRYVSFDNLSGEVDHMVLCVLCDDKYLAVADNNFPGTYEWMPKSEGFRRWKMDCGIPGWLFAFRDAPPPPSPK